MRTAATEVEIVPYEAWHGDHIAAHMRMSDRREMYYLATMKPLPGLRASVATAQSVQVALVDKEPVLAWGISRRTFLSDVGVPWLLGTDKAEQYQFRFGRASRTYYEEMASHFPVMENWALAENRKTLRWLKWLGFDMEEAKPFGAFGAPFVRFGKALSCA